MYFIHFLQDSMSSGADSEVASQDAGSPSPPPAATTKAPGTNKTTNPGSTPSSPTNNAKGKSGMY